MRLSQVILLPGVFLAPCGGRKGEQAGKRQVEGFQEWVSYNEFRESVSRLVIPSAPQARSPDWAPAAGRHQGTMKQSRKFRAAAVGIPGVSQPTFGGAKPSR